MGKVLITISGEAYDRRKKEFKKIREKYGFVSITSSPYRHVWVISDTEAVSCNYFRDDMDITTEVSIEWAGHDLSPLLKNLIKLFISQQEDK